MNPIDEYVKVAGLLGKAKEFGKRVVGHEARAAEHAAEETGRKAKVLKVMREMGEEHPHPTNLIEYQGFKGRSGTDIHRQVSDAAAGAAVDEAHAVAKAEGLRNATTKARHQVAAGAGGAALVGGGTVAALRSRKEKRASSPLDEYLTKYAGKPEGFYGTLASAGHAAVIGGAIAGIGMAVRKIHGAMTKQRDFKQMMSLNPQLADAQTQHPEMFNQAYSSLRKMNPTFGADPIVAGAFMHKMMVLNPEQAGMILAEAAGAKGPQPFGLSEMSIGPARFK